MLNREAALGPTDVSDLTVTAGILLLVIGIALLAFELVHPGIFLLIPGSVLTAAGVMILVIPGVFLTTIYGPIIITVVAIGAMVGIIPLYRRWAPVRPPMVSIPSTMAGRQGLVIVPVIPNTIRGKVKIDSEVWSASADQPIATGTMVRVVSGEGVSIRVEPVPASNSG